MVTRYLKNRGSEDPGVLGLGTTCRTVRLVPEKHVICWTCWCGPSGRTGIEHVSRSPPGPPGTSLLLSSFTLNVNTTSILLNPLDESPTFMDFLRRPWVLSRNKILQDFRFRSDRSESSCVQSDTCKVTYYELYVIREVYMENLLMNCFDRTLFYPTNRNHPLHHSTIRDTHTFRSVLLTTGRCYHLPLITETTPGEVYSSF